MKRNDRFAANRSVDWKRQPRLTVADARLKISVRQKARLADARDHLNLIAKRTDARQKLLKLKANKIKQKNQQIPYISLTRTISGNVPVRSRLGNGTKNKIYVADTGRRLFKRSDDRTVSGNKKLTITAANDTTEKPEIQDDDDLEHMTLDDLPIIKPLKNNFQMRETSGFSSLNLSSNLQSRLSPLDNLSSSQGFKVIVNNLHSDVTQDDIQELFGEIGRLRKAVLNKHGFAEVTFFEMSDAIKACEVYNNRQLDGKPMLVKLLPDYAHHRPTVAPSSYLENSVTRPKVSPDVEVIRRALFRKGTSATSSQQPMFTITMTKK